MAIRTVTTVAQKSKITADGIEASAIPNPIKPGAIAYFSATTAPEGWIKANGAAISRTVYADLFAAIGTTHGSGDGSSTFNVPDLRGEFVRGLDDGRGVDTGRVLGSTQTGSNASHSHGAGTLATSSAGAHTHGIPTFSGSHQALFTVGENSGAQSFINQTSSGGAHSHSMTGSTASDGGEARPRNVAMLACIKF